MASIRFELWDDAQTWLREVAKAPGTEWAYVVMVDRSDRNAAEPQVGRYERPTDDAYLEGTDDLIRWAYQTATNNSAGMARTVYRMRVYQAKGGGTKFGSFQFIAFDDAAAALEAEVMPRTAKEAEEVAATRAITKVTDGYERLVKTVLDTFAAFMQTASGQNTQLQAQVRESRAAETTLWTTMADDRRKTMTTDADIRIAEAEVQSRERVISEGLKSLKSVAELAMETSAGERGIPASALPEELRDLLRDPAVKKMLEDPAHRAMVVDGVREIARGLTGGDKESPAAAAVPETEV